MKETPALVKRVDVISDKYRRILLETGWDEWEPGQFVMIGVPGNAVFLRRPFGIVDIEDGVLEICFKIVGPGTGALAGIVDRDSINVLGPLGKGFEAESGKHHVLVAGGYGIAPLLGLARKLEKSGDKVSFCYGAKSAKDLLYIDELDDLSIDLRLATEDGSKGDKGFVTEVVKELLGGIDNPSLYACGPEAMMAETAKIGRKKDIPTQVSLDRYMACGMGVCLGCICESRDGEHLRACKEGPVFHANELAW